MTNMIRTYRYRVKDGNQARWLRSRARSVNEVWNWCNDIQKHTIRHNMKKWPTWFDLNKLSSGCGQELGLHSQTIQAVCEKYADSRKISKRPYLRYRGNKARGWIPFKAAGIKLCHGAVVYCKRRLRFWDSREFPEEFKILTGSFAEDSAGKWFLNVTIEIPDNECLPAEGQIGIDLGLKTLAAFSDGTKIERSRFYRDLEPKIKIAQKARKKRRIRALHLKIANRRRDKNHKVSTAIVRNHGLIVVGNVSSSKLAKTTMAKSVMDQGWSDFKTMLSYKAIGRSGIFLEVNEANTTRTCSSCGSRTGPKGFAG